MSTREGGGNDGRRGTPPPEDLAALLRRGNDQRQDPMGLARGQRLDRQAAAFLRSLGVEAKEGEEMTEALRRVATELNSGQKAEMKERASRLLESLLEPPGQGPSRPG